MKIEGSAGQIAEKGGELSIRRASVAYYYYQDHESFKGGDNFFVDCEPQMFSHREIRQSLTVLAMFGKKAAMAINHYMNMLVILSWYHH